MQTFGEEVHSDYSTMVASRLQNTQNVPCATANFEYAIVWCQ